jgi:uncharacterized protein YjiK
MRLVLFTLLALGACADGSRSAPPPGPDADVPYRLDAPDAVVDLPAELQEISGLTVLPSGRLGAVQDETGTVFEVDPATGAIVDRLDFEGAGDFEGVELVPGDAVWALRSDGDLYRVYRDSTGAPAVRVFETALRSRNDTESLAYDAAGGRLLIACKEWPGEDPETGANYDGVRTIYAFDFDTERVSERPVVVLPRNVVDGRINFRPSALAVHPETGHLYVLSSVRTAIAVVDPNGEVLVVLDFPPGLLPQPEGLAFTADGTLYVASEGGTGPGRLARFAPTD